MVVGPGDFVATCKILWQKLRAEPSLIDGMPFGFFPNVVIGPAVELDGNGSVCLDQGVTAQAGVVVGRAAGE